jgi:hypothetical protein
MLPNSYALPPRFESWPPTIYFDPSPTHTRSWCETLLSGQVLAIALVCLAIVWLILSCRPREGCADAGRSTTPSQNRVYGHFSDGDAVEYSGTPANRPAASLGGEIVSNGTFDRGFALVENKRDSSATSAEISRAFLGSELERADALSGLPPPAVRANSNALELGEPGVESSSYEAVGVGRVASVGAGSAVGGADLEGAFRNSAETEELLSHPELAPIKRARVMPSSWRKTGPGEQQQTLSPEAQEFARYAISQKQVEDALQSQGTMRLGENSRLNLSRLGSRSLLRETVAGNPGDRRLPPDAKVVPFNDSDPHELSITRRRV